VENAKKTTGADKAFAAIDVKNRLFSPDHLKEKYGPPNSAGPAGGGGSQVEKLGGELLDIRNDCVGKTAHVASTHLFSFLLKRYVVGQISGLTDNYGGAGCFFGLRREFVCPCPQWPHNDASFSGFFNPFALRKARCGGENFRLRN
jgi:hypothetical protein